MSKFGTPQQIAEAYVDEMDTSELVDNINLNRKILGIVLGGVVMALGFWLCVVSWSLIYNLEQSDGTIETYIEIVAETKNGGTE